MGKLDHANLLLDHPEASIGRMNAEIRAELAQLAVSSEVAIAEEYHYE